MQNWTPLHREAPYRYIRAAIDLATHGKQIENVCIVEIGCMRQDFNHPILQEPADCPSKLDGHSTVHFAHTGAQFFSVDISDAAIALATKKTVQYPRTKLFKMDGLKFLRNFVKRIDLLFLDAWDVDLQDSADRHLDAFKYSQKNTNPGTVVLIDDCDVQIIDGKLAPSILKYGGKGEKVVPYALSLGYRVVMDGRCVLMVKG